MDCPLCGTPGRQRFSAHDIPVLDCPACRHRYAGWVPTPSHIETVYADAYFHGGGAGYPNYLADANLHRQHGRSYGELLARYQRPGRILDVGAAAGFILQGMSDCGRMGVGLEPNAAMAAFGRDRLGLPIQTGDAGHLGLRGAVRRDLIHPSLGPLPGPIGGLPPRRRPHETARHLVDRNAELRQPDGPLARWSLARIQLAERLALVEPAGVEAGAGPLGYSLRGTGYPQKWIGLRHTKSLLSHKYPLAAGLLKRISDGLAVPYPSEDLFWAVYQKV